MLKEVNKGINNRNILHIQGLEGLILRVNTTQSNLHIQCNPYHKTNNYFEGIKKKLMLKFLGNFNGTQIGKTILKMKN